MLRTLAIAAAATLALGAASLAPSTASARGWHHGHHHHWHGHHHHWRGHRHWHPRAFYRAPVYGAYNSCLRQRWVRTPWGPRLRTVNVCF